RCALIPFVTAGDSDPTITVPLMHEMVAAGANIIELGVPFSDPMADGPVIQRASERALAYHVSLTDVMGMVAEFRQSDNDTPVILMGYLNPIEVMGYAKFAQAAQVAGVDGVLTVDLPPEEGAELMSLLSDAEIDPIFLIAPTTEDARIETLCTHGRGFVYYVSLKGVTGAASLDVEAVSEKVDQIRTHTSLPVGVGFGIKDGESAARVAAVADAVVVGSVIVNLVEACAGSMDKTLDQVAALLRDIRTAIDAV
ncbi:MAG TPA: tryptophan synthase subunit alpha, partial [Chromatiales bacterium]|nr:tryptophan synthase subunit alpha [Chromatiales bacterium]